jgi:hypothetical protein
MMEQQNGSTSEPGSRKAKYVTLAFLLAWVATVFGYTVLKFAKVI